MMFRNTVSQGNLTKRLGNETPLECVWCASAGSATIMKAWSHMVVAIDGRVQSSSAGRLGDHHESMETVFM